MTISRPQFVSMAVWVLLLFETSCGICQMKPPYPPSPVIERVTWDFQTHRRLAPGSDNWPVTWSDDGHLYAPWGDGGGFGGTNSKGRVKLGFARIMGDESHYEGKNIWGGYQAENPAAFEGKSWGSLGIDGVLYMWVTSQPALHMASCQVAASINRGVNWKRTDWKFTYRDNLTIPTFLNFGRDYAGARDGFVYSYYIHPTWGPENRPQTEHGFDVHKPGRIYLSRVPKGSVLDRNQYEFFAGYQKSGEPEWSKDLDEKQPVFRDPNGVGWNLSVVYNPGLKRYLLCTEHVESHAGKFGMFDAPEPWGPWTTVAYQETFGKDHIEPTTFFGT